MEPSRSTVDSWGAGRGRTLLRIARESLADALGLGQPGSYDEPWLREPGATFITLRSLGSLRGCVGSVQAYRPLFDDVWRNARSAAFHDTRFPPLEPREYSELSVEVSLLSPPEPLACSCEEEALFLLRPGVDGVILEHQECRGTFLPQVWEQLPDPQDFLDQLRRKAGLRPGFWTPDVRLSRYTVLKWVEED
ncbi:MAG TPA: AmmeMemoRadiSam system protein A [Thermoanaerobaculia bacterium]|nr:AmmeMemoRadiSam system protein A [Thermoanaerobaculia bacterium]